MRRFGHVLLTIATLVSLLLCATTTAAWVRSHWIGDRWDYDRQQPNRDGDRSDTRTIQSACGLFIYYTTTSWISGDYHQFQPSSSRNRWESVPPTYFDSKMINLAPVYDWSFMGIGYARWKQPDSSSHMVILPYWLITLFFAFLPVARTSSRLLTRTRKRRRLSRGLCSCCGYDLRASTEICPECGTPITTTR